MKVTYDICFLFLFVLHGQFMDTLSKFYFLLIFTTIANHFNVCIVLYLFVIGHLDMTYGIPYYNP